jgi:hypothetical protein
MAPHLVHILICRGTAVILGLGLFTAGTPQAGAQTLDAGSRGASPAQRALDARVQTSYGHLPLSFEANLGQADPAVDFLVRGQGYSLSLEPTGAVLTLQTAVANAKPSVPEQSPGDAAASTVRLTPIGANPHSQPQPVDPLPGRINYLVSNDPNQWRTNIPTFGSIAYPGVYPGIDLVYDGTQGQLEYTFVVAPGRDPGMIGLNVDGADSPAVDGNGSLVMHTSSGDLRTGHLPGRGRDTARCFWRVRPHRRQ